MRIFLNLCCGLSLLLVAAVPCVADETYDTGVTPREEPKRRIPALPAVHMPSMPSMPKVKVPSGLTGATKARLAGALGDRRAAVPPFYAGADMYLAPGFDLANETASGTAQYDFGTDLGIELFVGARRGPLRLELTIFHQNREPDSLSFSGSTLQTEGGIDTWGYLVGGAWDFLPERKISPYAGGAVGLIDTAFDISASGVPLIYDESQRFAWRGNVGASYHVNERFEAFGEARYFGYGKHEVRTTASLPAEAEMTGWGAAGGVRANF